MNDKQELEMQELSEDKTVRISDFNMLAGIPNLRWWVMHRENVLCSIVSPMELFSDHLSRLIEHSTYVPAKRMAPVGIFDTERDEFVAFTLNFVPRGLREKYKILPFKFNQPFSTIETTDCYIFTNFRKQEKELVDVSADPITEILIDMMAKEFSDNPDDFILMRRFSGIAVGSDGDMKEYNFSISHMLGGTSIYGNVEGIKFRISIPLGQGGVVKIDNATSVHADIFDRHAVSVAGPQIWKSLTA